MTQQKTLCSEKSWIPANPNTEISCAEPRTLVSAYEFRLCCYVEAVEPAALCLVLIYLSLLVNKAFNRTTVRAGIAAMGQQQNDVSSRPQLSSRVKREGLVGVKRERDDAGPVVPPSASAQTVDLTGAVRVQLWMHV